MAKYRHIDPAIRRSESVSKLDFRQRDLWYGLILTVDDQGRCPSNPALIRSDVWPLDDISIQQVSDDLGALETLGFIQLYQVDSKQYLQLLNWHKYQSSSEWLGLSDYPAPDGWQDRYRFHGKNRQIIQSGNWMQSSPLPKELKPESSPLPIEDVNEDVDGNGNGNDDVDVNSGGLQSTFTDLYPGLKPRNNFQGAEWTLAYNRMQIAGVTPAIMRRAARELADKQMKVASPGSLVNPCLMVMQKDPPRKSNSEGAFKDAVIT